MPFDKKTYEWWKKHYGKPIKHPLIGKKVWYRPYASKVRPEWRGKYAGVVIDARKVEDITGSYISLAIKRGNKIGYARVRDVTTKKPKPKKKR